ncbi:Rhodocoxin reductase [Nonomuraea coxensis DSM 45129]|uniref:Rhodocoxin reductase n=1 Tax=Nonomuraea coxensis DSM 45129 TaxID=1122611 RepID=A0ABX8UDF3_9ACTN|nr:FAD-dependent oxidoreductase [Nonomuraea coxensis]QYC45820.1 Rhodocoxin reductase [Nonomuraea coxensis DSM 45129]
MTRTLIVGASVGGVRTAQALRTSGYDGEIVLVDRETEAPYDKPPLSKALLTGSATPDGIRLLTPKQADAARIDLRLGRRAVGLDPRARVVSFDDGSSSGYDHVVVATGGVAHRPPWATTDGVHVVRTLADAIALRRDLVAGGPLVVIGAGFVGAEIASTGRLLGLEVTLVDSQPVPMSRSLSPDVAKAVLALHEGAGIRCLMGVGVSGVSGSRGRLTVTLDDGAELEAATVVAGVGAAANDAWLATSGLEVDDGVVCDEQGRAVGATDVYAVGDVARWFDPARGRHVRAEHWTNAVEQAACVARNILDPSSPRAHQPVHFVWSDQHAWKIQVIGDASRSVAATVLGDPMADQRFAALYADEGDRLRGAVVVNWPRALVQCRKAMRDGTAWRDLEALLLTSGGRVGRPG